MVLPTGGSGPPNINFYRPQELTSGWQDVWGLDRQGGHSFSLVLIFILCTGLALRMVNLTLFPSCSLSLKTQCNQIPFCQPETSCWCNLTYVSHSANISGRSFAKKHESAREGWPFLAWRKKVHTTRPSYKHLEDMLWLSSGQTLWGI